MAFSTYQYARFVLAVGSTTLTTVGTVPAATQWLVKDITVSNAGAAAATVLVNFAGQPVLPTVSAPPNQTIHLTGLWVLNAADTIQLQAGAASGIVLFVSGQTGV